MSLDRLKRKDCREKGAVTLLFTLAMLIVKGGAKLKPYYSKCGATVA